MILSWLSVLVRAGLFLICPVPYCVAFGIPTKSLRCILGPLYFGKPWIPVFVFPALQGCQKLFSASQLQLLLLEWAVALRLLTYWLLFSVLPPQCLTALVALHTTVPSNICILYFLQHFLFVLHSRVGLKQRSQYVITYNGKESEKECIHTHICMYNWITLLYTWNIINQLYINKK